MSFIWPPFNGPWGKKRISRKKYASKVEAAIAPCIEKARASDGFSDEKIAFKVFTDSSPMMPPLDVYIKCENPLNARSLAGWVTVAIDIDGLVRKGGRYYVPDNPYQHRDYVGEDAQKLLDHDANIAKIFADFTECACAAVKKTGEKYTILKE